MSTPAVPPLVGELRRTVVEVTGEDRLTYLDAVLSQRLVGLTPPVATSALELGPHGEPNGVLDLVVLEDRVLLVLLPSQAGEVADRLAERTFLADATFQRRDDLAALRVRGDAAAVLAEVGAGGTHGEVVVDGATVWVQWQHGADVLCPPDEVDDVRAALVAAGAAEADEDQLDAAEVAAGVPRAPEEITRGRLPEELGLLPTHVHLDKGCYPGQEAVARMWMLGRPRRRLAVVELPEGTRPGHVVDAPGAVEVTRVARLEGRTLGLAFVGRDTAVGDRPHDGVAVLELVGEGRPVPGHDPSVVRRRDR